MAADMEAAAAATRRFCLARWPAYVRPRRVFFVERLPVTGTNKVDRRALREETLRRLPGGLGSDNQRL